jgi:hypothetical protein
MLIDGISSRVGYFNIDMRGDYFVYALIKLVFRKGLQKIFFNATRGRYEILIFIFIIFA